VPERACGQSFHPGTTRAGDGTLRLPRLARACDRPFTSPASRVRNREHGLQLVSIVGSDTCTNRWGRALPTLFCLLAVPALAQGQRYVEIASRLDITNYLSGFVLESGKASVTHSYPIKCIVGISGWRIDIAVASNGKEAWYFDGTNVVRSVQLTGDAGPHSRTVGKPVELPFSEAKSNLTLYVMPPSSGAPLGFLEVNIPWLAFCSGPYLRREGRVVPLPTTDVLGDPEAFAYRDETRLFADELGLPESVELFASEVRYRSSVIDKRLNRIPRVLDARLQQLKWAVPDGILGFAYRVDESTNLLGWDFPTLCHFTGFRPDREGTWRPSVAGACKVTSLRESSRPGSVFAPDMRQVVVDFRFRDDTRLVDSISYPSTNAALLPASDAWLQATFKGRVQMARLDPTLGFKHRRFIVVAVLGLSLMIPVYAILRGRYKKHEKSKIMNKL